MTLHRHPLPRFLLAFLAGGPVGLAGSWASAPPTFDPALPAAIEVTRTPTGHLLVRPRIDGVEVGAFVLDTGASVHLIDPAALGRLALRQVATRATQDIGGHTRRSRVWQAGELRLGAGRWSEPHFLEHDLGYLSRHLGIEIAGILGHDLFAGAVAEIELGAGRLALHDPLLFRLDGDSWRPLRLVGGVPQLQARFEDHEGWFALDTGAAAENVTLHSPTVRRLGLLDDRRTRPFELAGASGPSSLRAGHLAWFELDCHRFERPAASFALARRGPLASRSAAGTIGGGLLGDFKLVLDYAGERIALLPLARP